MSLKRWASALAVGALGVAAVGTVATAADLPVKAPPPPPVVGLDMHAFFDVSFKNDYITPRGLLVTNTGLTTQILAGLSADVYKNQGGFINLVSFYGYVWNDLWSEQGDPHVGSWNEFDWAVGMTVKFAQNWKFGVEYVEFLPPAHDLITSFPRTERNVEFTLAYDDSSWWGPVPFAINPYVKLFYAASGPSTVVLGKGGDTYDVEIGIVPSYNFKKTTGVPLTISAPTWVTVGPEDYWNRGVFIAGNGTIGNIMDRFFAGATNFCGINSNEACKTDGLGVVSTGLTGKYALEFMPPQYGSWYIKAGFQYYHIINDALQAAQMFTSAASKLSNVYGTFPQTHQDVFVGFGGVGFSF